MRPVEQAVFTSVENGHRAGYLVVAHSAGIDPADLGELALWGPSHDGLLDPSPEAASFNFHPLPSGAQAVSRTIGLAWNGDGRSDRLYTQSLVVPPETLARFGNHPFAVIDAASARGAWQVLQPPYPPLKPLLLDRSAPWVDQSLLRRLAANPGPEGMAALVQAARDAACLALCGGRSAADVMAGLMSCLPAECRPEFSFSTGLKFHPQRPFHIVALSDDPAEQSWAAHHHNVTVLDLQDRETLAAMPKDGWAQLIQRVLSGGQVPFLAAQLARRRTGLAVADLPALGLQLLEELEGASGCYPQPTEWPMGSGAPPARSAHAAHYGFAKSDKTAPAPARRPRGCAAELDPNSPETLEKLEHLDDLVFEAINGDDRAMEQLQTAWPKLLAEVDDSLLQQSREQYLRYALTIWQNCTEPDGLRHPAAAIRAIDVLCLLFGEAP